MTLTGIRYFRVLAFLALACVSGGAFAAAPCDAPWMHPGGGFSLTSEPGGHVTEFTVTDFAKTDGANCKGSIRTDFSLTVAGQTTRSQAEVTLEIAGGKVRPPSETTPGQTQADGGAGAMSAALQDQASGLLSYISEVTAEGQRLPGSRTEMSMSGMLGKLGAAAGQISMPHVVLVTSERVVGRQEQLDTPLGRYPCWPISYTRRQEGPAAMMAMAGSFNAVTQVVDHFCPASGLVMREDMTVNDKQSSQAVTALH